MTQFSRELGDERQRVVQVRVDIRNQRALRSWELAEFYAKNDYYRAARHYLTKVVDEYPETTLAQQSRQRLDEYQNKPDNPDPPLEFLVNWLPRSKKEGPAIPQDYQNVATRTDDTTRR